MKVSVIIACHNAEPYIGEALASVADQEYPPHEVIVIDDDSTDDSVAVIENSRQPVRLLHVDVRNAAAARNAGIRAASGDWIAFLDADDVWFSHHLKSAVGLLEDSDAVAHKCFYEELRIGGNTVPMEPWPVTEPRTDLNHEQFFNWFTSIQYFGHSGVLYLRERVMEVGGFDEELRRRHDFELFMRVIHDHVWAMNPTLNYRWRADTPGAISRNYANCEYFHTMALLKMRELYAGPVMERELVKQARHALTAAALAGDDQDRARARELCLPLLKESQPFTAAIWQYTPVAYRWITQCRRRMLAIKAKWASAQKQRSRQNGTVAA